MQACFHVSETVSVLWISPFVPSFRDPTCEGHHSIAAFLWLTSLSMIASRSVRVLPPFRRWAEARSRRATSCSWRISVHPGSQTRAGPPPQPCIGGEAPSGEMFAVCKAPADPTLLLEGCLFQPFHCCFVSMYRWMYFHLSASYQLINEGKEPVNYFPQCMPFSVIFMSSECAWMEVKPHLFAFRYLLSSYRAPRMV